VQEISQKIKCSNIRAINTRAENLDTKFDYILSRAVTNMPKFVGWVKPLIKRSKQISPQRGIIALKGGDIQEEMGELFSRAQIIEVSDYFEDDFFTSKLIVHLPSLEKEEHEVCESNPFLRKKENNKFIQLSESVTFKIDDQKLYFIDKNLKSNIANNNIKHSILPNGNILLCSNEEIQLFDFKELKYLGSGAKLPNVNNERLLINNCYYDLHGNISNIKDNLNKYHIPNSELVLTIDKIKYIKNDAGVLDHDDFDSDKEDLDYYSFDSGAEFNYENMYDEYEENIHIPIPIQEVCIYNKNLNKLNVLNIYPKESTDGPVWTTKPTDPKLFFDLSPFFETEDRLFIEDFNIDEISKEHELLIFWIHSNEFIIFPKLIINNIKINCTIQEHVEHAKAHYKLIREEWINIAYYRDNISFLEKEKIPYFFENGDLYMKEKALPAIFINDSQYKILHLE